MTITGKAIYLHDADAAGRGLEPDPVQPGGLHPAGVRHQLRGDAPGPDPRQLPHPPRLLLRPALQRGGAPRRVQALPPRPAEGPRQARGRGRGAAGPGAPLAVSEDPLAYVVMCQVSICKIIHCRYRLIRTKIYYKFLLN